MRLRLVLTAAAILAAFGVSAESRAADTAPAGHRAKAHHGAHHGARHRAWRGVGGYRYGYQNTPSIVTGAENYPGYTNNQSLWERVETQRNYPVGY
jgi:hypothetical protein